MSDVTKVSPEAWWSWHDKLGVQFHPDAAHTSDGDFGYSYNRAFRAFYPQVAHALVLLSRAFQPNSGESNFHVETTGKVLAVSTAIRLRHRSTRFPPAPTPRQAVLRGLEVIAACVAQGDSWATPEMLDALAHAYEVTLASEEP